MIDPTRPPPLMAWRLLLVPMSVTIYSGVWVVLRIFGVRIAIW